MCDEVVTSSALEMIGRCSPCVTAGSATAIGIAALYVLAPFPASAADRGRAFTVRDSIEMSRFSQDPELTQEHRLGWSPDHHHFMTVTVRGLVDSNELESTIWVFDAEAAKRAVIGSRKARHVDPIKLVALRANSNDDPISRVRWSADSQSIAFLGRTPEAGRRLYVVDVTSGQRQALTPADQDVTNFDWCGESFLYTAQRLVTEANLYESAGPSMRDIEAGSGQSLFAYLYPEWERTTYSQQPNQLWRSVDGNVVPVLDATTAAPLSLTSTDILSVSPSGHFAVVLTYALRISAAWELYEPAFQANYTKIVADSPGQSSAAKPNRPQQYSIIDLERGVVEPLLDAPLGVTSGYEDTVQAAWSRDEKTVALSNTFVPLDEHDPPSARMLRPCVVVVDRVSRKAACVRESPTFDIGTEASVAHLASIAWLGSDQQLVLRYTRYDGAPNPAPELFQEERSSWVKAAPSRAGRMIEAQTIGQDVSFAIRQGVNEPPVVIATSLETGKTAVLWNPNPQLAGLVLGEASIYRWRDPAGHEWVGGLLKPPHYVRGHRYPLVIQTHGFSQNEFITDGIVTTANAARAIAGRGMVVLQVDEITVGYATAQEASLEGLPGYGASIESLAADGLVDATRVGIIGFSRTGWYVLDSLIRVPRLFRAATLAESTYMSYGEYLLNADYGSPEVRKNIVEVVGSEPVGQGLAQWLRESPGFNTDKIQAPILFEANDPPGLIYAWDIYAALRRQGKPVDLLYMRNGDHVLNKPLERLASQEMNVDWYDFWLNEHEDPDPAKAEQYKRWRELRKVQMAQDAERASAGKQPATVH